MSLAINGFSVLPALAVEKQLKNIFVQAKNTLVAFFFLLLLITSDGWVLLLNTNLMKLKLLIKIFVLIKMRK